MTVLKTPYFLGGSRRYCPFPSQYILTERVVWRQHGLALRGESGSHVGSGNFMKGDGRWGMGASAQGVKEEVIGAFIRTSESGAGQEGKSFEGGGVFLRAINTCQDHPPSR